MKTELFREINGRFVLIEHGDPHFYCINSMRTVFRRPNKKVSKNLWSDFAQFKRIPTKKPFRVEERTSIYLCHRLLFEFPENLKLFGHVLYNTDDYTYVESRPECLVISAMGTPLFSVFSKVQEFVRNRRFQPEIRTFCHFCTGRTAF